MKPFNLLTVLLLAFFANSVQASVDSYRFLHVTIETPWMIFIFLLMILLVPFILMAVLYWYYAGKKDESDESQGS